MAISVRRALVAVTALVLAVAGGLVAAAPAPAQPSISTLTGIRTGLHPGFDRIVLDLTGPRPGVTHELTDELIADGSGQVVWLTGERFVSVAVSPAVAHNDAGNRTFAGADRFRTRNLTNVMAIALTGDFEGYVSIGLGIRHDSWVTVFTLASPTRVVIDVGH